MVNFNNELSVADINRYYHIMPIIKVHPAPIKVKQPEDDNCNCNSVDWLNKLLSNIELKDGKLVVQTKDVPVLEKENKVAMKVVKKLLNGMFSMSTVHGLNYLSSGFARISRSA